MMGHTNFVVPENLINRIRDELKATDHDSMGDQIWLNHPKELDAARIVPTGGGCEAYFVDVPWSGQNLLIVWTDNAGMNLPTPEDWLVGIFIGEVITETPVLSLSSEA